MDTITIQDLEVYYHVGVTDAERAATQRLLLTIQVEHDFRSAAAGDSLADTIDYDALARRLLVFGDGNHWQLIETLATDIAEMVQEEFKAQSVRVEVKKFPVPQARHVSVQLTRSRA